jgi:hypothetical protein
MTGLTPIAAVTYRHERMRAVSTGVLETAGATFLQLIALRWFDAAPWGKAVIVGGGSFGLLLSPISVSVVGARGWPPNRAAAALAAFGALCHLAAAAVPWLPLYTVCVVVATASYTAAIPLVTHMYQENYPAARRGELFSRTVMLRIGAAAGFGWLGGALLGADIAHFRWMLLMFAAAMGFGAWCLWRSPTPPLENSAGSHPFRSLRHAWHDKLFQRTLVCWMLMGFANLMMLPMRVEYLGNPRHGLDLSAAEIALLTLFLPNLARLALSPLWGRLFDRMNFFSLRITLNIGFALGILTFFTSESWPGLVLAAVVYGVSSAGGDVVWSLWVIKFAPPGRVAEYMAVHTFFTGVRGVAAPFAAYYGMNALSLPALAWISVAMIGASALLLWPERKSDRRQRKAAPLVEEVSD